MASTTTLLKWCLSILCLHVLTSLVYSETYTFDLTEKYFDDVSMNCDHPGLNITERTDVRSLLWILPDGTAIDSRRKPNPKHFKVSGPNADLEVYTLTAMNINDPVFGFYICVVVYDSEEEPISVIKWGLNVDGADFTELIKTYEDNAIVGGIGAATMLVVLGAGCLLWHFRYSKRNKEIAMQMQEELYHEDVNAKNTSGYHNSSYISHNEISDFEISNEIGNVDNNTDADMRGGNNEKTQTT